MKLICERNEDVSGLIVETVGGAKRHYIEGIFIQAGITNRNGRVYPVSLMEEEVAKYQDKIRSKTAFGELDHPTTPTINMKNVSHLITELRQDGNNFIGKAMVTSTPMGQIVKGLIEDGAAFAVSSRGVGEMKKKGNSLMEVVQYRICTAADIVADPSAPDAMVRGIMEGAEWVYDVATSSWKAAEVIEQIQEEFHQIRPSTVTAEQKLAAFAKLMKIL